MSFSSLTDAGPLKTNSRLPNITLEKILQRPFLCLERDDFALYLIRKKLFLGLFRALVAGISLDAGTPPPPCEGVHLTHTHEDKACLEPNIEVAQWFMFVTRSEFFFRYVSHARPILTVKRKLKHDKSR